MSDPFASADLKLSRAKKKLAVLKRRAANAVNKQTYEMFGDPHPDKPDLVVCKMRLTKQLPDSIPELTSDIVKGLREVLDNALYGISVAAGKTPRLGTTLFPFSKDSTVFENNLKGRCADVPQELWPLLRSYEPYQGGSDLLFALNELCNSDKHAIAMPVGTMKVATGISMEGTGFMSAPYPAPVWDSDKNEMELFTIHRTATEKLKMNLQFGSFVAFGKVGIASGRPVIPNLERMVESVETIIGEMKTEARKLGLVK